MPTRAGTRARARASIVGSRSFDQNVNFGSLARGAPPAAFLTTYDNREALREYFKGLLSSWSMIHYTIDEYVAQGDAVFARDSCAWIAPKVDFWRFRNGKAIEFYEYYDTASVLQSAGRKADNP
jgi:ketosteroid isomerase-like protein